METIETPGPYAPPANTEIARQAVTGLRSLVLFALGCILFVGADSIGVPALRTHGPYALYGILVPGNALGFATLIYAILSARDFRWRIMFSLGLLACLASLSLTGLIVLWHVFLSEFPGPG